MVNLKCYRAMEKTTKRPQRNFGLMQREALKFIKGNDLRVYVDLLSYADNHGQCFPSVETIANDLGITTRNVQKHLANLEAEGWIVKNLRTNTSTLYQLHFVDTSESPVKTTKRKLQGTSKSDVSLVSNSDVSGTSKIDASGVSKSDVLTDQLSDQKNIQQEQVVSVVGTGDETNKEKYLLTVDQKEKFEELWKKFKQEGESKASALSAWSRYCSLEDEQLMRYIENSLDNTLGTYMTNQMKQLYDILISDRMKKQKKAELKANGEWREL